MNKAVDYKIYVYYLDSAKANPNLTLHIEIQKISLKPFSSLSKDKFYLTQRQYAFLPNSDLIHTDETHIHKNYTPPDAEPHIYLSRKITIEDLSKQELELMPGFRFTW